MAGLNGLSQAIWNTNDKHGFHEPIDDKYLEIAVDCLNVVAHEARILEAHRKDLPMPEKQPYDFKWMSLQYKERAMKIMLIVTELIEAFESSHNHIDHGDEIADILIRTLHYARVEGIDIDKVLRAKMEKNEGRPYKHGKAF